MTRQSCSTPIYIKQSVTEHDGRTTTYTYDGMGRTVKMEYPHGWVEDYHYDSIGQLLKVEDTDPSGKDMKQQKHVYQYDDCGNMTYEYMRGNGTGEATVENFYTYDALHRVTNAKENYGNASRTYQYDSLGNLTWETNSNNVTTDYKLNNLNQITEKSSDGWKTHTTFTYDKRGNLIQEQYGKNKKVTSIGTYTYDETNKMVEGVNANAESSSYLYNGLGALVEQTWVIAKNSYGYHDVLAEAVDPVAEEPETAEPGIMLLSSSKKDHSGKKPSDKPTGSEVKKTSTVVKEFVVDYTTETFEPLMEHEVNGLTYRYVYGNDRLSVNITGVETGSSKLIENGNQIRLYYHMDYLGTADYLTSPLTGKVESWTHYNEWGEITHNAVLKCGQRELDLVKRYATHDFDAVLNQYYAKARFYDAENRYFTAMDPILDPSQYDLTFYTEAPTLFVGYAYVSNNPIIYIDLLGLFKTGDRLSYGRTNPQSDVMKLQEALNKFMPYLQLPIADDGKTDFDDAYDITITKKLTVNGVFDSATLKAVNMFKDAIMPGGNVGAYRGVVGDTTWDALGLDKYSSDGRRYIKGNAVQMPTVSTITGLPNWNDRMEVIEWFGNAFNTAPGTLFAWDPVQGIWYARIDAVQRMGGYNDFYNDVFAVASEGDVSFRSFISIFDTKNPKYSWRIEGWKGNYFQMGVGTEIGMYGEPVAEHQERYHSKHVLDWFPKLMCNTRHFPVAPANYWPTISLSLYANNKLLFTRPTQKHWWLDGFDPYATMTNPNNLTVIADIDFGYEEIAKGFVDNVRAGKKGEGISYRGKVTSALNMSSSRIGSKVSITWR